MIRSGRNVEASKRPAPATHLVPMMRNEMLKWRIVPALKKIGALLTHEDAGIVRASLVSHRPLPVFATRCKNAPTITSPTCRLLSGFFRVANRPSISGMTVFK
jgi:hypothetical protein